MNERGKQILSFLLGIIIIAVLASLAGKDVFKHLGDVTAVAVLSSLSVYGLSWFFRTERLGFMLESNIGFRKIFGLNIGGYAGNIFLPAKAGDLLRALYLENSGVERSRAFVSILFTRIHDLLAITVIFLAFIPAFLRFSLPEWFLIPVALGIAFLISFTSFSLIGLGFLKPYVVKAEILLSRKLFDNQFDVSGKAIDIFDSYLKPKMSVQLLIRSLAIWVLEVFSAYLIAISIVNDVSLIFVFVAVSFGNIAKVIPATPGGFGLYEGAVASVLSLSGVPYSAAFTIALVEHSLKNLFIVVIGSYFLSKEGLNLIQPHL